MRASKHALHCVSSQTRSSMLPPPASMHLSSAGVQMSLRHLSFSARVGRIGNRCIDSLSRLRRGCYTTPFVLAGVHLQTAGGGAVRLVALDVRERRVRI